MDTLTMVMITGIANTPLNFLMLIGNLSKQLWSQTATELSSLWVILHFPEFYINGIMLHALLFGDSEE